MESRNYVIFDYSEVETIDFDEVMQNSVATLRLSIDETKALIKYEGSMPDSVVALTAKTQEYNHSEILDIMRTDEWSSSELIGE